MAITAVGSTASATGTALKTLAVSPTAIGDVLVLGVACASTTVHISAVSGGGVTTWTKLILANPGSTEGDSELWFGPITTTGAATITITTTASSSITLFARQYNGPGGVGTWATDGAGAASTSTSTASSGNYPSVTPANSGELYVGLANLPAGSLGGSTANFTYANQSFAQFVYNPNASTPTAQSPAWTQSTANWSACSALLTFTPTPITATGAAAATFVGAGAGVIILPATGAAAATFVGSGAGVLQLFATGSIVSTFVGLATPLPPILLAPTVSAVAGYDGTTPIITVTVVVDVTGTRGAFTIVATLLRNDGTYVIGASPLFPLAVSSTTPTASIVHLVAPYGVETTYVAESIIMESIGQQFSPPSIPSAQVLMGQAPDTVDLYGRMGWAKDQDTTGVLEQMLSGIGQLIQTVDTLSRDGTDVNDNPAPGWSQVLDINRAPTYVLPWLAQFLGVRLDSSIRDDQMRYQIKNPPGFARGPPG